MNAFELASVVLTCAAGWLGGHYLCNYYGGWGWCIGALLGAGSVILTFAALNCVLKVRKWIPPCENGKCREDDYRYVGAHADGKLFECKCGQKYVLSSNFFMKVSNDGSLRRYMIRSKPGGRWDNDSGGRNA